MLTPPDHPTPARPRHPWRVLLPLLGAVLLAHALLLGLLPVGVGDGWRGGVQPRVQVRQIATVPAPAVPAAVPVSEPAETPSAEPPAPPLPLPPPTPVAAAPEAEPAASAPLVAQAAPAAASEAAPSPAASAAASAPPAADPDAGGQALPVYATRLPAPVLLRYTLQRGALQGSGELAWRPADGRYTLSMEGTAFSIKVLDWRSEGGIDSAGIAPERFVDRRRSRDVRAANFQRSGENAGRITFSGPQVSYPLHPGSQDRLSWMLQLSAIVEADAAAFVPGRQVHLFVVGARGDADVWTFTVEGRETLDLPAGRTADTLRLRREPRKPYDTLGEIWLDPARSHLPVRVLLTVPQSGDSTEFLLASARPL